MKHNETAVINLGFRKILLLMLGIFSIFLISCSSANYDAFAQCLTDNGAKMYGAYWCPHCQTQKNMFGRSFDNVNYVECSLPNGEGETEICIKEDIKGYPTWEFADGQRIAGVISFEELSRVTGCELSQEKV